MQPSTFELAKREDFASLPIVPSDFIRKHGATYSGEQINANFVLRQSCYGHSTVPGVYGIKLQGYSSTTSFVRKSLATCAVTIINRLSPRAFLRKRFAINPRSNIYMVVTLTD